MAKTTDIDFALYEAVLEPIEEDISQEWSILGPSAVRDLAETAVAALVTGGWLEAGQCGFANASKTIDCENLAPLGQAYCHQHSTPN